MILQLDWTTIWDITLILYGTLTGFLFLFGTDLLKRYFSADKQTRGDAAYLIFFSIGASLCFYGVYMIFATYNYFFTPNGEGVDWVTSFQQLCVMLILVVLATTMEGIIFKKRRLLKIGNLSIGFLSLIAIATSIYIVSLVISDIQDIDNEWNLPIFIPVFVAYAIFGLITFAGFLNILLIRLSPQKATKRKIIAGLVALILGVAIGAIFGMIGRASQNELYYLGTLIEIIGWLLLREFFLSIPSYSELEWKSGIVEMHVIMAETGISLFYRSFRKINPDSLKGDLNVTMTIPEESRPNSDLVGGGMIGIKGMLSEIAGTKGKLQNIQIGEKNLIFNQGENVLVLLLADRYLGVYNSILIQMVREIEETHPGLPTFNGDTRQLHIGPIVSKYFGEPEDEKVNKKKAEKSPAEEKENIPAEKKSGSKKSSPK